MLNEIKFSEGMSLLCETYQREPSKLLMQAYYMALKDLSDSEFETAIGKVLQDRKFNKMPMPGEIREYAIGNAEDKAILAYDAFTKGKAQTGAYESVVFEDKLIHAVVQSMGGWYEVCMITEDEWKFKRREFIDLYRAISRSPGREIPERLIGLGEAGCSQNPDWMRHTPLPRMINHHGEVLGHQQIAHDKQGMIE
uniref:DUF6475 domain-containing protein n=2 Tax=viral metagenome TaxID=1070528 RepID=A0A6M3J9G8_9ZZZZ